MSIEVDHIDKLFGDFVALDDVSVRIPTGGLTALLAMLNSCASNVSVVNIDNGFGAGCVASVINRL